MFKKLLLAVVTWIAMLGFAFAAAQVDVNKADQAALDGIKGIGPKTSTAILDARKKDGNFKDWADLEKRVKGIGPKSAVHLSDAGLTVNGQTKSGSGAASSDKNDTSDKETKKTKTDVKKGSKESKSAKAE